MEDGLDPAYVTRLFQVIRKEGEPLPELPFHGLGHSAASLMLAGKADTSTVYKLLGHSSISIRIPVDKPKWWSKWWSDP
jgi:integrase